MFRGNILCNLHAYTKVIAMQDKGEQVAAQPFLQGGGKMGTLIRSRDWTQNPLGAPSGWPAALKQTVSMLNNTPLPILACWGSNYIQFYNDAFRPILGESKHPQALGNRAGETFKEIWPQIGPMFKQVMEGKALSATDFRVTLERDGRSTDCYFDFAYSPIKDEYGTVCGVLVICMETTGKFLAVREMEEANREIALSKAMVMEERDRLNRFFLQAPAGICILDGPDFVFELINDPYQQLFPGRQLQGLPLLEALPECKNSPVWDILQDVYHRGTTFQGNQLLVPLARTSGGSIDERYFNFVYQPRIGQKGKVDGVLVFVHEVTELVVAGKELSKTKGSLEMAISAAMLGTFEYNREDKNIRLDGRCRQLLGIGHDGKISYREDILGGIDPGDHEILSNAVRAAFKPGATEKLIDTEFRVAGSAQPLAWIKVTGRVYGVTGEQPARFLGTIMDITERKMDEMRKNDFIGMVSHELKTPLTSLSGILQLLSFKLDGSADTFLSGAIGKAYTQVKKMNNLINGFLNMARFSSGKMLVDKQRFTLQDLITEIVSEIAFTSRSHNINIINSGQMLEVDADRDKIGSVISNLLSNAVKYSPDDPHIEVRSFKTGNEAIVSITDYGLGIQPSDLQKVFDRYYRVESTRTKFISGFGIGLYLSAEIIKEHGGRIWVESGSGKGSTFSFSLPLS